MGNILETKDFLNLFPDNIIISFDTYNGTNMKNNVSLDDAFMLNSEKKKQDIYFTPNGSFKKIFGDVVQSKGRSKENAKKGNIYAFVMDVDGGGEEWRGIGIDPTIVIKTKNGYHLYFMLENPVSAKDYWKERDSIETKMVALFKGDPKAKDLARMYRVPGFKYWKDNKGTITIDVLSYNKDIKYTFKDFKKLIESNYEFACKDDIAKDELQKKYKGHKDRIGDIFKDISDVDVANVLEDLYPQFIVGSDMGIRENGKKTRGYKLNKYGNYINNFSNDDIDSRPRGGPRTVAKQYFGSNQETLNYFYDKFGIDKRDDGFNFDDVSSNKIQTVKTVSGEELEKFGNDFLHIVIDTKNYRILGVNDGGEDVFIDALITSPGYIIKGENRKYVIKISKLNNNTGELEEQFGLLPTTATNTELRKFLMQFGIISKDNNKWFLLFIEYIFKDANELGYTNKLGFQIINGNKIIISKTGTYLLEKENVYVDIKDISGESITYEERSVDFNTVAKLLIDGYGGVVSIPFLLSTILGINAYYFRNSNVPGIGLMSTYITGLSGAGKTTIQELLFREMLGIDYSVSAMTSAYVYMKHMRHYIPIHMSDYRHGEHKEGRKVELLVRSLFDGKDDSRGNANQTITNYEANCQFCFDGQTYFKDDAARTRTVYLSANPRLRGDKFSLSSVPNIYRAATQIFKDQEDFNKRRSEVDTMEEKINKQFALKRGDTRTVLNYAEMFLLAERIGLDPKYSKYIGDALKIQDSVNNTDDIKAVYQKVFNYQTINKFETYIYKGGMVIDIIGEQLPYNANIEDLGGFITVINNHFLEGHNLFDLSIYIDFEYVFNDTQLHPSFLRMLGATAFNNDLTSYLEEERKSLFALKEFLKDKKQEHLMSYIRGEIGLSSFKNNNTKNDYGKISN